jgi:hypothetical protein
MMMITKNFGNVNIAEKTLQKKSNVYLMKNIVIHLDVFDAEGKDIMHHRVMLPNM